MGSTAKGLALIPELAALGPSASTAVAAATAAVIGQGISHGWRNWAAQVQAREWMDTPYFAQERLSGTRLETVLDPPHGIKYVKVCSVCDMLVIAEQMQNAETGCKCRAIHLLLAASGQSSTPDCSPFHCARGKQLMLLPMQATVLHAKLHLHP